MYNFKKLLSFTYIDQQDYLREVGGCGNSTPSLAFYHYISCNPQSKRSELSMLKAISQFIDSGDFGLDFKHFEGLLF